MSDVSVTRAVPLTRMWARDGLASVILASLQDAGFHATIDCDPRGPMHFYGWPLGSAGPMTIWIAESEYDEALEFIGCACELPWEDGDEDLGRFVTATSRGRRLIYLGWLVGDLFGGATGLLAALGLVLAVRAARDEAPSRR